MLPCFISTTSIWWKATAEATGREPIAVVFQYEGSESSLHAETERQLLEKLNRLGLVMSATRGSNTAAAVETLAALGYRIISIETIDEAPSTP